MIGRLFWFGAGAAAAVYTRSRVRRTTERLTPEGLSDQLSAAAAGLRFFATEVQSGMAERERELRASRGLPQAVRPMLLASAETSRPPERGAA